MWLVIGYGSPLHSDDRLGWTVAERLATMLDTTLVDVSACNQLTPEWSEPISRADGVIFVDAEAELAAGQIRCVELRTPEAKAIRLTIPPAEGGEGESQGVLSAGGAFSHFVTPQSLMDAADALYGHAPRGWLYTVGAANLELGETLSSAVADAIPAVVEQIRERILADARVQHR